METKGILLWAGLILICAVIFFFSQRIKKQIEEHGIETEGVISRIEDEGEPGETNFHYYAKYRTEDGEEVEGTLSNPAPDLAVGQRVRLKYHPKYKSNARLIDP